MRDFRLFSKNEYRRKEQLLIVAFSIFPVIFLIGFTYLPLINMIYYSFTDWDGISKVKNIVGFDNYVKIFTDPQYLSVFRVSLFYIAGSAIQLVVALGVATILNFEVKFKNFFKGVLFFPYLMNGVAVSMMFIFFFQPEGILDSFLTLIGFEELIRQWLGDPGIINYSMVFISIWRSLGFSIVIYLGAMQSIDESIYEAANVDGANKFDVFKNIILPSIRPILSLQIILAVKGALSVFETPFIMTNGANGSTTFVIQTMKTAFTYEKVGLASAMAMVLFMIIIILTVVQKILVKESN